MGISLDSLSITSAFNSILSFFKSQENNSKWKDLSSGAEGTFLIRMLANILSNISYRLVTARRENYISTANLKSSALGIALNLGYSAHRGTNQKRKIQFEPNSDYVIPSHTVIGAYNEDYDVIYIGDLDAKTHLREGLVLQGPSFLSNIVSMNAITKTITLSDDVTAEISVGDTIEVNDSGANDGRYTITNINTFASGNIVRTDVSVLEEFDRTIDSKGAVTRIGIQEFKTVIGKLKTITWTAGTNKTQPFTRFEENISEDYILYKDGEEVPSSNIVRDLNNDMYLVRTNPYSSVDVLYLNHIATNTHKYGSESVFTLKYVELADIDTKDYDVNMSYGKVVNTLTIDNFIPFEEIEDIKINAPLDHEVQHLIRSKKDYTQRVLQYLPNIIETSYQAITPTYTLISYLKDDCTLVEQKEIDVLNSILKDENYFGTPLPDITPPNREGIKLIIQVFVTDKMKDSNDIRYDISSIIKTNYSTLLNQTFDTFALERLIEELSYVKWARVSYDIGTWASRAVVDMGDLIKVNDTYYKATKVLGVSSGTEPTWNIPVTKELLTIDLDGVYETQDGNIIWRAYKRLDVDNISKYQTSHKYALGEYIYTDLYPHFMFKAVDFVKSSGATTSLDTATTFEGDFLIDGELVWVCKAFNSSYDMRFPSTAYRLGSSANINDKSFEVVSYIGKTGYTAPNFEKAYYNIAGKVTPMQVIDYFIGDAGSSYFQVSGDQRQYFDQGAVFNATTDKGYSESYRVYGRIYDDIGDRTSIYVDTKISTKTVPISTIGSDTNPKSLYYRLNYFELDGNQLEYFKIGDRIKAFGFKVDNFTSIDTSYDYSIAEVAYFNTTNATRVYVRSTIDAEVTFTQLASAGFTSIQSPYNNSFILDTNLEPFFPADGIIRAKTDEDTEMTYSIVTSKYQSTFQQTFVTVKQEIARNTNYTRVAPAWSGTEDGEIRWAIVEDPDNIMYDWNVYNDIEYKSTISY